MEQFNLISYHDMGRDEIIRVISTIGSDFDGWQNYNSEEPHSLKNLLLNNQRYNTGGFHFLMDGNEPVCCAGFYKHDDVMLVLTRAFTWPSFRPSKYLSNIFLPRQIELSRGLASEAWLNVNGYNRRILSSLKRNGALGVGGLKNSHDLYSQFQYDKYPVMINHVPQYIARLALI